MSHNEKPKNLQFFDIFGNLLLERAEHSIIIINPGGEEMTRKEFLKKPIDAVKKVVEGAKEVVKDKLEPRDTEMTRREFLKNPLGIKMDESGHGKTDQEATGEDNKITRREFLTGK